MREDREWTEWRNRKYKNSRLKDILLHNEQRVWPQFVLISLLLKSHFDFLILF